MHELDHATVDNISIVIFKSCSSLGLANLLDEIRDSVEEISHESSVGNLEDWRIRVLVDSDNQLRLFHPCKMLNGSRDTNSNIELRSNDLK